MKPFLTLMLYLVIPVYTYAQESSENAPKVLKYWTYEVAVKKANSKSAPLFESMKALVTISEETIKIRNKAGSSFTIVQRIPKTRQEPFVDDNGVSNDGYNIYSFETVDEQGLDCTVLIFDYDHDNDPTALLKVVYPTYSLFFRLRKAE